MKLVTSLLLVLSAIPLITAAEPKAAAPEELKKLEGSWVCQSAERKGEPRSEKAVKGMKIVVKSGQITFFDGNKADPGRISIDPTTDPKEFDISIKNVPHKLGIYSVDGEVWKICLAEVNGKRPREFSSKPETGGTDLYVFKREK